jgi:formylglycine-generating enzyme required for sulfatase activity
MCAGVIKTSADRTSDRAKRFSSWLGPWLRVLLLSIFIFFGTADAQVTQLSIKGLKATYASPRLLEFDFSLRDQNDHAMVTAVSNITVVCKENGSPISQSETGYRLLPGNIKKLKCYLVLDYTGSMALAKDSNGDGKSDAIEAMETAAKIIVGITNADAQIGIYEFHRTGSDPQRIVSLTTDKPFLTNQVNQIFDKINPMFGGSRCWDAVYQAVNEFSSSNPKEEQCFVVFLSDGKDESSTHLPNDISNLARNNNVKVICLGFGPELVPQSLQNMASQTSGQYYSATTPAGLIAQFQQIAKDVEGQYILRWATIKTSATAFTPSFELTYQGVTAVYTAPSYYPPSYAGNELVGTLKFDPVPVQSGVNLLLKADYIPLGIMAMRITYTSAEVPLVEKVPEAEGGVCPYDWLLTHYTNTGVIELKSPRPTVAATAIPYAILGKVLRFRFSTNNNPGACFNSFAVDNSIYTKGQSFQILNADTVTLDPQTVTFSALSDRYITESPFTVSATASSGLPVTFRVMSGPATLNGDQVTLTGTGAVTVRAVQLGDAQYSTAFADQRFVVLTKQDQTINFPSLPDRITNEVFYLTANASSGLPITFSVLSGPAQVISNKVSLTGLGPVTIRAEQAGNYQYNATHQDGSFVVLATLPKQTPFQWLARYGITNDLVLAEISDLDGDGVPTWQEYQLGTNPTIRNSEFWITGIRLGNGCQITFNTESGWIYRVEYSDLMKQWQVLESGIAGTGSPTNVVDAASIQSKSQRYYRVGRRGPDPDKWSWISPGTFAMGSPESEPGRSSDEGPQTTVNLTKGFWMSRTETTQAEYLAVMGSNPSGFTGDLQQPVDRVSWYDGTNYCGKLTQQERAAGRLPAGYEYRLPTEAEWEYACRAGSRTRFYWGDDSSENQIGQYAWYHSNGLDTTRPVKQKIVNGWGLYDMSGNVWEWCADWYGSYPGGIVTDPQGATSGSTRVMRGGGAGSGATDCRSARRYGGSPDSRGVSTGFRAVLVPGQ